MTDAFWTNLLGALLGVLAVAFLYFFSLERNLTNGALFLRELVPLATERHLIVLTLLGKTTLLGIVPAVVCATLQAGGRRRAATLGYVAALWLVLFFLIVDLRLYLLHGRHLLQILAFATLPEGHEAGGNVGTWFVRFATWAVQAAIFALTALPVQWLCSRLVAKLESSLIRAAIALPLGVAMVGLAPAAVQPGAGWRTMGLHARFLSVLPFKLGGSLNSLTVAPSDPQHAALQRALTAAYQSKFSFLFRRREVAEHRADAARPGPNVFLILIESWRADALTPELMPRLHAWSELGLRRTRHHAGTNFSESGTFAILYGMNPLVYHAVLDSRVSPPLCDGLQSLSFSCAYFTGHPTVWWRREEFLGPATFDIHRRVQQGTWNDWDREALGGLVTLARTTTQQRIFGVTFLMSTHYEYRYPPQFERFRPAHEPAVSWNGGLAGTDFVSTSNRYKNALGYVDDIVGEALSALDTTRDYVIVTGDHGEALGENGRVGHGFDFSDSVVRVPFILRGPDIEPRALDSLSLHSDIWPTVLSLVTGEPNERDLRKDNQRQGTLLAHCEFKEPEADALLMHGDLRIRLKLGLQTPELRVVGFEDPQGKPLLIPDLGPDRAREVTHAFDAYLDEAARPVLTAR